LLRSSKSGRLEELELELEVELEAQVEETQLQDDKLFCGQVAAIRARLSVSSHL